MAKLKNWGQHGVATVLICLLGVGFMAFITWLITPLLHPDDAEEVAQQEAVSEAEYAAYVDDFDAMSIDELEDTLEDSDGQYIFIGQASCPFCRLIIDDLHAFDSDKDVLAYVDGGNLSEEENAQLNSLGIAKTPTVLYTEDGQTEEIEINVIEPDLSALYDHYEARE